MKHLKATLTLAALMATGLQAQAATYDAAGDFLSTFTGSHQGALDVLSSEVTFDSVANKFTVRANTAGDIASASNVTFVFGFNTGAGKNAPFGSIGAPNVAFDTTVQLRSNGTGVTAGQALDVKIDGNHITSTFDAGLLRSTGFSNDKYQWSLWTIDTSIAGLARNADFAPGFNLQVAAVPEPQTYALMAAGLAAVGGIARRRRHLQA